MKVLVIGGGIGGFATALSLHAVGIECEVCEPSRGIPSRVSETEGQIGGHFHPGGSVC